MLRQFPTRSLLFAALASLSLLASAGCGSDSPTGPGTSQPTPDPEPEVFTPVAARITSVAVEAYGSKDGDDWDWTYGSAPERPDIYVTLHTGSSATAPFYVSDVRDEAYSGVRYTFTSSSAGTGLPKSVPAGTTLVVRMMDEDGASADDYMGAVSVRPSTRHSGANVDDFTWYLSGSNGTKFVVKGKWLY